MLDWIFRPEYVIPGNEEFCQSLIIYFRSFREETKWFPRNPVFLFLSKIHIRPYVHPSISSCFLSFCRAKPSVFVSPTRQQYSLSSSPTRTVLFYIFDVYLQWIISKYILKGHFRKSKILFEPNTRKQWFPSEFLMLRKVSTFFFGLMTVLLIDLLPASQVCAACV